MGIELCSIASGSSGNCIYIGADKVKLLLDCGLSGKRICQGLEQIGVIPQELTGILVTHEHSDHVHGVGVMSRRFDLPIYANQGTWEAMESKIGAIKDHNIKIIDSNKCFSIGSVDVKTYSIPHDAREPVGYSFFAKGKKVTIATDLGHASQELKQNLYDSDLLLLESNHDIEMLKMGSYPWPLKQRILGDNGHLSNEAAGIIISELVENNVARVVLAHLSKENNFPELAYQTVFSILTERGIRVGQDVKISLAHRDKPSEICTVT
jgi:phosphoribosyl 1,2-cyclic phosphodiesterase